MKKNVKVVLNGLRIAICVVDRQRNLLFVNTEGKRVFGDDADNAALRRVLENDALLFALDKVSAGEESATADILVPAVVPISYRVTVTRFDSEFEKSVFRAAISFEDISHLHDAEVMRSDFVANVSHELRSPLTAVYGLIETLQGPARGDPEAQDRFLDMMSTEAKRMMRLVDDLLSLSKYQASERKYPVGQLDVVPLLKSVVSTLSSVISQEQKKVTVNSTLLRTYVRGDADELRQVFQNLIENAIKYSPKGTEVTVSTCMSTSAPDQLCICVQDKGEGISPADIPRLTERFYRIDKGRSRAKGGTGLGLAIVKHILIRHRGRLKIESELGKGSTFSVYLPLVNRR